jgi:hypothetical protein
VSVASAATLAEKLQSDEVAADYTIKQLDYLAGNCATDLTAKFRHLTKTCDCISVPADDDYDQLRQASYGRTGPPSYFDDEDDLHNFRPATDSLDELWAEIEKKYTAG